MKNLEILIFILDSSFSLAESETASLARAIAEFQQDTKRTKWTRINPGLRAFVDSLVPPLFLEPALPKRRTRTTRELLPSYNPSWLIDKDKFPAEVSRFKAITAPPAIDPTIQQLIFSAVTSAIAAAMAFAQAKHEEDMLVLREMIKNALLFRESGSSIPPSNPNASSKLAPPADLPTKSTERWNQTDLGYSTPTSIEHTKKVR